MPRKHQLRSGSYRIQAYDYTDDSGKRHYKSFTAPSMKEAKALRNEWQLRRRNEPKQEDLRIADAVGRYIALKEPVLSPATVRGYETIIRTHLRGDFGRLRLSEVDSKAAQYWISELAKERTPKTVKNAYGLISATLAMFAPDVRLSVQLPASKKPDLYCPSDDDIRALLEQLRDDPELELAVLLAAFGPLRRGEVCALEDTDIRGNVIRISKSMVEGPGGVWSIKGPKTAGSYRSVEYPDSVIAKIPRRRGRIILSNPDQISRRFRHAIDKSGLPHFRFHDLRHYGASIMHAIGVPDQYIMQRGGWSSDSVMRSVYRNVIDLESAKQNRRIVQHFGAISR